MAENEMTQANALESKTKLKGKIAKITIGGAIIDLGMELPGVIHISQLQKEHLTRVEDAVEVGQEVEVWVRRAKKDRIELTMIEPLTLEWREMKPEVTVKGSVVRLETYGAFVEIGAERPGLVHVSEIAHGYIKDPSQVVKVGDEVDVMILEVNRRKKQIRLSMKATLPEPEESLDRPKRGRGGKRTNTRSVAAMMAEIDDEPKTPEHTAMEMAWQAALDRADSAKKGGKKAAEKKVEANSDLTQDEILARTLEQRK
ncbi:MAG: S1 RNA-binding domain-containing protein [Anaerolineae bacterium]|jgi:small subunit ribosomal protein S1|nr:S1 RNA-binding domain-containing protein [Anaerolineae bacterium]MBT7069792.1 S1 RNA-binding domain-containing protein [Anaerolineae bacterium]MBT7326716.1 S1 RNA-binding domain-containing protein [Anaerolineae bacterium]MBT7601357.1 S1 RNA-binding domain-containing protein [Anaerolineae bacterium]